MKEKKLSKYSKIYFLLALGFFACSERNLETECHTSAELIDAKKSSNYGLTVFRNPEDAMECSFVNKKPTLVYFTGYGLVSSSREIKTPMLEERATKKLIEDNFNFCALYVDDRRPIGDEYFDVKHFLEKNYIEKCKASNSFRIRNTGNLHAAFQICATLTNAQPEFAIFDHNGNFIANGGGYSHDEENIRDFLRSYLNLLKSDDKINK